jgi:hypothetical protein
MNGMAFSRKTHFTHFDISLPDIYIRNFCAVLLGGAS